MYHEQSDSYDLFICLLSGMVSSHLRLQPSRQAALADRKTRLVIQYLLEMQTIKQDEYEMTCELLQTTQFRRIA
ncbi:MULTISPECIES: hypothetical protein [Paenibacillus]|uniref:hypothetical protein n=1 Tax=Paenibacillus TaxID=44249 RepID=UPI00096C8C2F|nr:MULTISPECIES: hypothetical protein [Paenibacillus]OMD22984.1 hypothetical protein BJP48_27875 [Paenibacillus odorifer]OME08088.1 hypothetical protein BSK60_30525 [Paenibacillus odorifer]OMF86062.1 hypothetical protein BK147_30830 [Paenibacillus sp. FSL R7-0337]